MKCKRCNGTGEEVDNKWMVHLRELADITQLECSKRMGISQQYLCDLEQGRRDWDTDKLEAFDKAIAGKNNGKRKAA